jgi:hypothetical protein
MTPSEMDAGLAAAELAHHSREAQPQVVKVCPPGCACPEEVIDEPTARLPRETMRQVVYGPEDCDATNGVDTRHFDDGMGG